MIVTLITRASWQCVLRAATPDSERPRIATLCASTLSYAPVLLQTVDLCDRDATLPRNLCPQCRIELAAHKATPAQCLESVRRVTRDLRGGRRVTENEWSESAVPEIVIEDLTGRRLLT